MERKNQRLSRFVAKQNQFSFMFNHLGVLLPCGVTSFVAKRLNRTPLTDIIHRHTIEPASYGHQGIWLYCIYL